MMRRYTWAEWANVDTPPLVSAGDSTTGPVYVLADDTRRWIVTTDADGVTVRDT